MRYNNKNISVLVTTYNACSTICDTLDSIAKQTYKGFEIILVDDGSQDRTVDMIKNWKKQNSDIRLRLFQPGRLGRIRALNFGVDKAKGEYIAICDADDLWHPDKLRLQYGILCNNNEIDVLATDIKIVIGKCEPSNIEPFNSKKVVSIDIQQLLHNNLICHSSALIKKELCNYKKELDTLEDYEVWLRLADQGYIISKLKLPLTFKRLHSDQYFETNNNFLYRFKGLQVLIPYLLKYNKYNLLIYNLITLFFGFLPKK